MTYSRIITLILTHAIELWFKTSFTKYQMISNNVRQSTIFRREKFILIDLRLNIWKTPKYVSQHEVLIYFLLVLEREDGEYTEIYSLSEHEDWEQREKKDYGMMIILSMISFCKHMNQLSNFISYWNICCVINLTECSFCIKV